MPDPRRFSLPTFWVIFCALLVYLTGNALSPLWDRDEPRYAQCSRQMLQSDDWVVPRLYDELRTAKPPVIYWLQATAMAAAGAEEAPMEVQAAAARLPSGIAMVLTLLLVAIAVRRAAGPEHAFWTVLVLGTSVLAIVAAKVCLTDAVLLLFITAGQLCIYRIWRGQATWPTIIALGVVDGVALMTKGPVVFGVHLTTLATLWFLRVSMNWGKREWRLVFLALVLIAIESLAGDYLLIWPGSSGKRGPAPIKVVLAVQVLTVGALVLAGRARTVGQFK
jgi:4-amino-4-deoxy-L-arabinose transferase-like glycosyltransferase